MFNCLLGILHWQERESTLHLQDKILVALVAKNLGVQWEVEGEHLLGQESEKRL